MPQKLYQKMDLELSAEERSILQKAAELCCQWAKDEELEDWAYSNCNVSFEDVADELFSFLNKSF